MQTYQDLNNYGNTPVNYGSWQDYTIVFGNNAGNLSATEYENGSFPLYKQTPLTTFSDVSRDLLINLTFSNVASLDDVTYFGENPNISVVSSAANAYTVLGVRSVSDYDEAFGNVFVTTVNGSLTGFLLTTLVDDQFGNTRTWTANVSLVANPGFSVTSPLTYNEDTYANITGVTVNDTGGNATQTYNMTVSVPSAAGDISYAGGAFANSVTITNTQSNITSSFSGNTWRFRPAADYTANTQATFNLVRTFDNRLWTRTANLNIGNTHSEYSVPTSISFTEDAFANIANISITDTRPNNIDPAIQYQISLVSSNVATGVIHYANVDYANLTLTNTKTNLNTIFSSNAIKWKPAADYLANTQITYSQTQVTDGVVQATAVVIPVIATGNAHGEYIIPASYSMAEDTTLSMSGISITDLRSNNIDANIQYSVTLISQDPANVKIRYNSVDSGSQNITGTKSAINAIFGNAAVRPSIVPDSDWFGNTTITYSQIQTTDGVTQANAVPINLFVSDSTEYSLTTNYLFPIVTNNYQRLIYEITDQDITANTYTITASQTQGPVGNFWINGVNQNSNSITITGNRSSVNSANISFLPNAANIANVNFNWGLVKTRFDTSNVTIAGNVVIAMVPAVTNLQLEYSYTANRLNVLPTPTIDGSFANTNTNITLSADSGFFRDNAISNTATINCTNLSSAEIALFLGGISRYWPARGQTGNANLNMQIVNLSTGTTWLNRTITLVGTNANVRPQDIKIDIFNPGSYSYNPSMYNRLYTDFDIVAVGGGGGGAWGGGGGGGGGVYTSTNLTWTRTQTTATIRVGAAGDSGSTGAFTWTHNRIGSNCTSTSVTFRQGDGQDGGDTSILNGPFGGTVRATGGKGGRRVFEYAVTAGAGFLPADQRGRGGNSGDSNIQNTNSGVLGNATQTLITCTVGSTSYTNFNFTFTGGGGGGAGSAANGITGGTGIASNLIVSGAVYGSGGGAGRSSNATPGNNGDSTQYYGDGGTSTRWLSTDIAPLSGQPGIVYIKWKVPGT